MIERGRGACGDGRCRASFTGPGDAAASPPAAETGPSGACPAVTGCVGSRARSRWRPRRPLSDSETLDAQPVVDRDAIGQASTTYEIRVVGWLFDVPPAQRGPGVTCSGTPERRPCSCGGVFRGPARPGDVEWHSTGGQRSSSTPGIGTTPAHGCGSLHPPMAFGSDWRAEDAARSRVGGRADIHGGSTRRRSDTGWTCLGGPPPSRAWSTLRRWLTRGSTETTAALADAESGRWGGLLGLPVDGQDRTVEALKAERPHRGGRIAAVESVCSMHPGAAAIASAGDWDVKRIGAKPPAAEVRLHSTATFEVLSAGGAWRRLCSRSRKGRRDGRASAALALHRGTAQAHRRR